MISISISISFIIHNSFPCRPALSFSLSLSLSLKRKKNPWPVIRGKECSCSNISLSLSLGCTIWLSNMILCHANANVNWVQCWKEEAALSFWGVSICLIEGQGCLHTLWKGHCLCGLYHVYGLATKSSCGHSNLIVTYLYSWEYTHVVVTCK